MTTHPTVVAAAAPAETEHTELFSAAMSALMELKLASYPERVTSDEEGLVLAAAAALRADCTRRKVGAIIVDVHGRIVGSGRNGAPSGRPGCLSAGACPRGKQDFATVKPGSSYVGGVSTCIAIHAEVNACLFTDPHARRGGTVFVSDAPCDPCALHLAGSGLARIVWPEQNPDGSWQAASRLIGPEHEIGGHYS